jgi:flagellar biosynthesis chaperone FliJ
MLSEKLAEVKKVFKEKIESSVKEISKLKDKRLVENERLESLIVSQPFYCNIFISGISKKLAVDSRKSFSELMNMLEVLLAEQKIDFEKTRKLSSHNKKVENFVNDFDS